MRKTSLVLALALTLATALPAAGSDDRQDGSWLDVAQGTVRGFWDRILQLFEELSVLPSNSGPYADPSGKPETSGG